MSRCTDLLSTKWVDYVEEPMKYCALRPQFFSMGGWGWWGGWWWGAEWWRGGGWCDKIIFLIKFKFSKMVGRSGGGRVDGGG